MKSGILGLVSFNGTITFKTCGTSGMTRKTAKAPHRNSDENRENFNIEYFYIFFFMHLDLFVMFFVVVINSRKI